MSNLPWLTLIVLFPFSASFLIPLLPYKGNKVVRWYTLGICALEFLLITFTFCCQFHLSDPSIQLKEDYNWISFLYFHWNLGVDGLSMGLILLTGFITTLAILAAWPVTRNVRLFYFLMLAMYSGQIGLFASQNILLFFFMWELELIPVYLLLSMWGGKKRLYSSTKFLLYTAGGSIFLLVGSLTMGLYGSNGTSFDLQILTNRSYPIAVETALYFSFLIAYAVKLPILPFHTWLPDTHGEAHYSTCMLLAGILLKMGGYGLIRINMELLPHAHFLFSPLLVTMGAVQIAYASLISFSLPNIKRRIAYSSVSHMGFVIIGISSITDIGTNGAILQMISHGLIGAALFFLAGISYDRTQTLYLDQLGGIAVPMPRLFTMFSFFSLASLALPGMSSFVAEFLIFLGIVTNPYYSLIFKSIILFIGAIGVILTPIYLLSMLRKMFYGFKIYQNSLFFIDLGPREIFISVFILLPILGIGIYPNLVLSLWNEKVESILLQYYG
uniref:NAD(P)H-quinone oxidoreductase chain 4, chloroplastic n=1 Tax=Psilotum nudum TaxID=3240 RepID=NU4C_PSINU|nr:NADH dehydrogenase subunit 4 [Psilotum nudum]Q8WHX8.2 RecName: Full=NAD(P)H-quinone oxidoreductase chain 4, chloroplastic; AltName: Full=NAD(P)H dehydrogenase, chain 4; AltName: Full=NADH-plastoquinone oxidoreductase chain 4 [Psilotum nudum]